MEASHRRIAGRRRHGGVQFNGDSIAAALLSTENANAKGQAAQVMVKDRLDGNFRSEQNSDGT